MELETLIVKQKIQELVLRYCHAVDRKDYKMLYTPIMQTPHVQWFWQGDEAEGKVVCTAYHLISDNQEIIIGGCYLDRYI